jgi:hypothetical protein
MLGNQFNRRPEAGPAFNGNENGETVKSKLL